MSSSHLHLLYCVYFSRLKSSCQEGSKYLSAVKIRLINVKSRGKINLGCSAVLARNKAALVGEIAVPCTCNPLQQG